MAIREYLRFIDKGKDWEINSMLDEARFVKNQLGYPKKAIKICDKILKIDDSCRDAMLIKAGAFGELFYIDEALELIKKIIQKWPEHWEGYYLLALNLTTTNNDEEGLKAINKSIELNENFDNVISKAQMLYFMGKSDYIEFVENAKKIDSKRTENFMQNHFIYDVDTVKPTISELIKVAKYLKKQKLK